MEYEGWHFNQKVFSINDVISILENAGMGTAIIPLFEEYYGKEELIKMLEGE